MTRQRQKQEGKRVQVVAPSAYARKTGTVIGEGRDEDGKFIRVRMDGNVGELRIAPENVAPLTEQASGLVSSVWINGKRRTVAELIANGKRKFESAQKAAGKEK